MVLNCSVGEDSWESFGLKEIQLVNPKRNQSWIFTGRTDAEAEIPILGPPDVMNWLIGKDPDARKDWRQKETGTTEDEMIGWHHQLDEHEFETILGVGDGQGSLACYSIWGCKQLNTTEWLNWTDLYLIVCLIARLCLLLCNGIECSMPDSSVHGDSPGKNTGVGCHAILHGIFPTQGSYPGLPQCRWILYHLSHQESPHLIIAFNIILISRS